MNFPRSTGILFHPISLPSHGGIGDLGPCGLRVPGFSCQGTAGSLASVAADPPANGNSPYSSISAFAGNPLLISLERLAEKGWLDRSSLPGPCATIGPIDYEQVRAQKLPLLRHAANNFLNQATQESRGRFDKFCSDNAWWLEDFVLFDAFREKHGNNWHQWPSHWRGVSRPPSNRREKNLEADLSICRVLQFFFWEQWHALRHYCAEKSIRVVGDIAIFVDYESADVWAHRDLFVYVKIFCRRSSPACRRIISAPTGQRWGNPLYNWDTMRRNGYRWWMQRLRWATQTCDFIRLDHFRGFAQFWEIPADEPTAIKGRWVDGPGDEFFFKLNDALGGLPFFAEDLGYDYSGRGRASRSSQYSGDGSLAICLWRRRRSRISSAPPDP